ncbi:hypothetical protein GUITHDRAFT_64039 [Guillardia theta CCMP2712]|uniref:RNA polymerase II subunit A C-terminal domain phosphatase SSU72 n=3 Tax=Guillardia theta TaxID=55529 RepID=L1JYS4_GUITC|nr:hypothetical protein GUITHDRAFT_64039 [Guillardia theta CCMP2712]EKX53726.1 hypothetical protein GUITHDRAFT_64039 [Guillardia theta CCMP2712]|mmetsp:Transcript_35213/g.110034  ORF Transcript_35213/g.110034 Transcript_35213/m.110034 type:complete len:199 (+) Transcript_35213:548-1144(+)|eukprot:XP_005840706.1 hypothetical protein GUITHDRAFT_64039 [Guillardia theta CCMP2712]
MVAEKKRLNFATVCSSNMNRSMEAHKQLLHSGFNVTSFGTGTNVRLPGPSQDKPNVYEFGTPYAEILVDLQRKDENLYRNNGLIAMLQRNVNVKRAPERWQDMDQNRKLDVVLTYEERVFDAVLQDLQGRESENMRAMHVINLETIDKHEEAVIAAQDTCQLCRMLESAADLESEIMEVLSKFEKNSKRSFMYSLVYL